MFNVIINSEQYDEFMAQKEKIKALEARIKDVDEMQSQIKELENWNDFLLKDLQKQRDKNEAQKEKFDLFYADYLDAIKKCDALENQVDDWKMRFESTYENYTKALSEKAAIIKERDELKMSINDLRANGKELKAKIKEPVGMIKINHCRDWEDVYSPDRNTNTKIENLYITNNYFSEEDGNNGDE